MPPWWFVIQRVVTFILGVGVIVDSLIEKDTATPAKLLVGLLLIGIPPIEDIIAMIRRNGHTVAPKQEQTP